MPAVDNVTVAPENQTIDPKTPSTVQGREVTMTVGTPRVRASTPQDILRPNLNCLRWTFVRLVHAATRL